MGLSMCLTPSGVPYVPSRGGPLVGEELLALQGIPAADLLLTKETEDNLKDLAGNAMTTVRTLTLSFVKIRDWSPPLMWVSLCFVLVEDGCRCNDCLCLTTHARLSPLSWFDEQGKESRSGLSFVSSSVIDALQSRRGYCSLFRTLRRVKQQIGTVFSEKLFGLEAISGKIDIVFTNV
jgi:hypothetical protein